ncbi:MAG: hypothetical protein J7L98_06765 [Candidatus Verstraetearchaeota archaeon]|nr:hypothetical protein [Candidatus Verstraetearchaeota archaeon]
MEEGARLTERLERFFSPRQIARVAHPEDIAPLVVDRGVSPYRYIIKPFSKVPPSIVCGRFWELRWAYGCIYDCAYCYLRGTCRGDMKPRYVRVEHVLKALDQVFSDPLFNGGKPALFNSGELSDSLMKPDFMEKIADKFAEQDRHKLLLLTKCGPAAVGFLLRRFRRNVVCAWSVNAVKVARLWERAPSPEERIEAARLVREAGYPVWIRIDPIFPIEDWEIHYEHLLYKLLSRLTPTRIILGTPRGLRKTLLYAKKAGVDMSWADFFKDGERTEWGLKLPFEIRRRIYLFIAEKLRELGYDIGKVTICKETVEMWRSLGWKYVPGACQCYGDHVVGLYT